MARATFVKKARKNYREHGIKKGESYYWWKFAFGSKRYSKTQPKPSQLTQSEFLSTVYSITETLEDLTIDDDFAEAVETAKGELETLMSETEDKLNNMPDQLQQAETGELMQGRVDSCQEMIDSLEAVDTDTEEMSGDDKESVLSELQSITYGGE